MASVTPRRQGRWRKGERKVKPIISLEVAALTIKQKIIANKKVHRGWHSGRKKVQGLRGLGLISAEGVGLSIVCSFGGLPVSLRRMTMAKTQAVLLTDHNCPTEPYRTRNKTSASHPARNCPTYGHDSFVMGSY